MSSFESGDYPMRALLFCGLLLALPAWADIVLHDDSGQEIRLKAPARRIVSLAPHITENLFSAGAGAAVVGVVDHSDFPEAARKLPRVGQSSRLDLEALLALKPDLVIAWKSGTSPAQLEKLNALGLPVYVSQTGKMEDIARDIERYGQLAGTSPVAHEVASHFRQRLARLRERYSGKPPVRVFYQIWHRPIITVGAPQIISDAIRLCGGQNVFGQLPVMAPTVSQEAVLAARPEAIVASGFGDNRPEWLEDWKKWPRLPAVQRDALFYINPDLIQRHTLRLLDGSEQLCRQLEAVRQRR